MFHLISLKKLRSFVSSEFSLFNTSENHKSQTVRAFRVPSIGTPCGNHVLPSVRFGAKTSEIKVGVAIVLAVWRCYGQNGPNLANFLLSTTLQVPNLHQQWNEIFRRCSTWSHSKSKDRLWVVNFLSLILPKIINHKRFELLEFRRLVHLVEIMCYHRWYLEPRKVK